MGFWEKGGKRWKKKEREKEIKGGGVGNMVAFTHHHTIKMHALSCLRRGCFAAMYVG